MRHYFSSAIDGRDLSLSYHSFWGPDLPGITMGCKVWASQILIEPLSLRLTDKIRGLRNNERRLAFLEGDP